MGVVFSAFTSGISRLPRMHINAMQDARRYGRKCLGRGFGLRTFIGLIAFITFMGFIAFIILSISSAFLSFSSNFKWTLIGIYVLFVVNHEGEEMDIQGAVEVTGKSV